MTSRWWIIAHRQGRVMRFWSNRSTPTYRETESARFTSATLAREHATKFPDLAEWIVVPWHPGKYSDQEKVF